MEDGEVSPTARPRATVVIPTRDRAALLPRLLRALADQTIPADRFEIVIVDNGSTDGTSEVLAEAATRMPNLRVLSEPVPGISAARNRGIGAARAPWIAFIDDDCIPAPSWLASTLACAESDPGVAAVVGRYGPPPHFVGPRWLHPAVISYDRGDRPERVEKLQGGNMMVRRDVLDRVGRFRTDLGMNGRRRAWGEETALARAIRAAGHEIQYCPDSFVHHLVKREKRHLLPLLREAFRRGLQEPAIEGRRIPLTGAARAAARAALGARRPDGAPWSAALFIRAYAATRWIGVAVADLRPGRDGRRG